MTEELWRVDDGYAFCAGVIFADGWCVRAAPYFAWVLRKKKFTFEELQRHCQRTGIHLERVE